MQAHSSWYDRIATEIGQYKITLGQKSAGKYKLDRLLRVAGRIDDFTSYCSECQAFKSEITRLVQELGLLTKMPGKPGIKNYTKSIDVMVAHLKKVHRLIEKGHYMGIGISFGWLIGAGLGAALGAAVDSPGIGTAVGIALGIAVGRYLDKKAEREGKVI